MMHFIYTPSALCLHDICKLTTQQQEAREEKREEEKTITGGSTNSRTNCRYYLPLSFAAPHTAIVHASTWRAAVSYMACI